jgi:hypothetical protein
MERGTVCTLLCQFIHRYDGEFSKGKFYGSGTLMYSDGNTYKGSFKNGLRHGYGEFYWKDDGMVYEGDWKNGEMHGNGVLRKPDGKEKKVRYDNGRRLNGQKSE